LNIKSSQYQPSRKVTLNLHQAKKTSPASNKITQRTAEKQNTQIFPKLGFIGDKLAPIFFKIFMNFLANNFKIKAVHE
jgi:hypothetical protein